MLMPFASKLKVKRPLQSEYAPAMQRESKSTQNPSYFPFGELYWALFHVLSNPLGCIVPKYSQHMYKPLCTFQKPQVLIKTTLQPNKKREYARALHERNIVTAHSHPVSAAEYVPHDADSRSPWPSPASPSRPHDPPSRSRRPVGGSWSRRRPSSASRCFARRRFGRGSGVCPLRCRIQRLLFPLDICRV